MLFYVIFICLNEYSVKSILSTFLFTTVSGQGAPTAEEKATGLAIANKLNELMRPKLSRASIKSMSRGLGVKKSALSGKQYLDFQLLVDSSGSIRSSNFDVAKDATNVSSFILALCLQWIWCFRFLFGRFYKKRDLNVVRLMR